MAGIEIETANPAQTSFAMCVTCAHNPAQHDGGACQAYSETNGTRWDCNCLEYWPPRYQFEDGLPVAGHEVSFGGSLPMVLNRRAPTELWERLRVGDHIVVEVEYVVEGEGFKRDGGVAVESRKLKAVELRVPAARG